MLAVLGYEPGEQDDVPGEGPGTVTQPARLSAAGFPAVMSAGVLQAASSPPVLASGPAVVPARARTRVRPAAGQLPAQVREEASSCRSSDAGSAGQPEQPGRA